MGATTHKDSGNLIVARPGRTGNVDGPLVGRGGGLGSDERGESNQSMRLVVELGALAVRDLAGEDRPDRAIVAHGQAPQQTCTSRLVRRSMVFAQRSDHYPVSARPSGCRVADTG